MREMFPLEGPSTGYKHQFIAACVVSSLLCRSVMAMWGGVIGLGEFRLCVQDCIAAEGGLVFR